MRARAAACAQRVSAARSQRRGSASITSLAITPSAPIVGGRERAGARVDEHAGAGGGERVHPPWPADAPMTPDEHVAGAGGGERRRRRRG